MKYEVTISVVMPCYNCEKYISSAIKSILTQTLYDFEFIIINDGSTDNSHGIITSYMDKRIKYIHLEKNIGNYAARNIGIDLAKGKYIAVMDADDISLPNRLIFQYNYMQKHHQIGCLGAFGAIINDQDQEIGKLVKILNYQEIKIHLLKDNCFLHSSLMIRNSFLKKYNLRYNEDLKYSSDYDFMCNCAKFFPVKNCSEVLVNYRVHDKQISREKKMEQKLFADFVRLKQLAEFKTSISERDKKLYLRLMNDEFLSNDQALTCLHLLNSLLANNEQMKLYLRRKLFNFFESILQYRRNGN